MSNGISTNAAARQRLLHKIEEKSTHQAHVPSTKSAGQLLVGVDLSELMDKDPTELMGTDPSALMGADQLVVGDKETKMNEFNEFLDVVAENPGIDAGSLYSLIDAKVSPEDRELVDNYVNAYTAMAQAGDDNQGAFDNYMSMQSKLMLMAQAGEPEDYNAQDVNASTMSFYESGESSGEASNNLMFSSYTNADYYNTAIQNAFQAKNINILYIVLLVMLEMSSIEADKMANDAKQVSRNKGAVSALNRYSSALLSLNQLSFPIQLSDGKGGFIELQMPEIDETTGEPVTPTNMVPVNDLYSLFCCAYGTEDGVSPANAKDLLQKSGMTDDLDPLRDELKAYAPQMFNPTTGITFNGSPDDRKAFNNLFAGYNTYENQQVSSISPDLQSINAFWPTGPNGDILFISDGQESFNSQVNANIEIVSTATTTGGNITTQLSTQLQATTTQFSQDNDMAVSIVSVLKNLRIIAN